MGCTSINVTAPVHFHSIFISNREYSCAFWNNWNVTTILLRSQRTTNFLNEACLIVNINRVELRWPSLLSAPRRLNISSSKVSPSDLAFFTVPSTVRNFRPTKKYDENKFVRPGKICGSGVLLREPHYPSVRDYRYPEFLSFSACKTILICIIGWVPRLTQYG